MATTNHQSAEGRDRQWKNIIEKKRETEAGRMRKWREAIGLAAGSDGKMACHQDKTCKLTDREKRDWQSPKRILVTSDSLQHVSIILTLASFLACRYD